jgi:hypothetical protein
MRPSSITNDRGAAVANAFEQARSEAEFGAVGQPAGIEATTPRNCNVGKAHRAGSNAAGREMPPRNQNPRPEFPCFNLKFPCPGQIRSLLSLTGKQQYDLTITISYSLDRSFFPANERNSLQYPRVQGIFR